MVSQTSYTNIEAFSLKEAKQVFVVDQIRVDLLRMDERRLFAVGEVREFFFQRMESCRCLSFREGCILSTTIMVTIDNASG